MVILEAAVYKRQGRFPTRGVRGNHPSSEDGNRTGTCHEEVDAVNRNLDNPRTTTERTTGDETRGIDLSDVVDAAQAAVMLGVTRQHVVHLCRTGRLPGRRLTATWVTTREAVETYARARRPPGRPRAG